MKYTENIKHEKGLPHHEFYDSSLRQSFYI